MATPSPIRRNQPSKRHSSLILPERKNKRPHKELPEPIMGNRSFITSFDTHDLDDATTLPLYDNTTKLRSDKAIKKSSYEDGSTIIDMTDDDLGSLDKKGNIPLEYDSNYLDEVTDSCSSLVTDLIELTDITGTIPTNLPPSPDPTKSAVSRSTKSITQLQHIEIPDTAQKTAPKRRKKNKGVATKSFDHYKYSTPINDIRQIRPPNYESLTIVELRNAVKKYGFKIRKDRQSMTTLLQNIWASTNNNTPAPGEPLPLTPEEPNLDGDLSLDDTKKQEFTARVKNDIPLWERILRYENVDMKTCTDGLSRKDKAAFHEYLDENALVYKPPPKSK